MKTEKSTVLTPCAELRNEWRHLSAIINASPNRTGELMAYEERLTAVWDTYRKKGCKLSLPPLKGFHPL